MLANDVPVQEIARQLGVSRQTVRNWSITPEAQEYITAVKTSVSEATKHLSVADKVRRIQLGQDMVLGILAVIKDRRDAGLTAKNPLPGERTGHVAVKTETLSNALTRREAAFDASLHRELRSWLEYVAKEKGELETGINVRHSGRVQHDHRFSGYEELEGLTLAEIELLEKVRERMDAGMVEAG